jgi:aldehyde dehydrogenase
VVNIVNGFGIEAGKPLAQSKRIAKIAFTGETTTGRLIMQYASENIIPVTLELGGKSPNIFFADVMDEDDDYFDKCLEGFAMFALNQGEVCTCPSRALVDAKIYDKFMDRALKRVGKIKQGHPLDPSTMLARRPPTTRSKDSLLLRYRQEGRREGSDRRQARKLDGEISDGFYIEPTVFEGNNKMRIFQEIFGPVVSVAKFNGEEEALSIANDTLYGLGARCGPATATALTVSAARSRQAVSGPTAITSIRHMRPSAATNSRASGVKTISKMLGHYQQTKNLLVSYSPRRSDSSEPASIACGKPAACDFLEQTMVARVEVTPS